MSRTTRSIALFGLFLLMTPRTATRVRADVCPGGRPPAIEFGRRVVDGRLVRGTLEIECPGSAQTRYLRLRLSLTGAAAGWSAVVRNRTGRAINIFNKNSFDGDVRWTDRIAGNCARIDLFTPSAEPAPTLRLDEYLVMGTATQRPYYSYEDETHKKIEPLYDVPNLDDQRLGDSVGLTFALRRQMVWACSAVAITPDIVMTNWHCGSPPDANPVDVWSQAICNATILDFSWDDDDRSREFVCREVLKASNPALDVAFLRVQAIERADVLRPATLLDRAPKAEPVLLVHHPEALPKQITRNCVAVADADVGTTRFAHTCDSEGGSSGAPVFDAQGRVLGLHHEGFLRDEQTCEPRDRLNKAVRIDAILAWLRDPHTPGGQALLQSLAIAQQ